MVNFGLNSTSLLGIFLVLAGAGLYLIRSIRPELARDHDIFFAAVGLLVGGILFFQGWRFDPIMQFSQFLLAGSTVFFAVETMRLRSIATEQAKGSRFSNYDRDEEEPPVSSRVYRAELDQLEAYEEDVEEDYDSRRLRGSQERSRGTTTTRSRKTSEPTTKRRRPSSTTTTRTPNNRPGRTPDIEVNEEDWETQPRSRTPRNEPPSPPPPNRKPRKKSSTQIDIGRSYDENDYVDYQPIDNQEDENNEDYTPNPRKDNPANFDY